MKKPDKPTSDSYDSILHAYEFFNQALFDKKLPKVLITYHRQRRIMGYASIARWVNSKKDYIDELSVNPEYFAKYPLLEICQTLCHEMVHIWQAHFGSPGRRGYHNKEFANKMRSIGLMASSTGKPGGAATGEAMSDYVLASGLFIKICRQLNKTGFVIPWVDRYPVFRHDVPILAYTDQGKTVELDAKFHAKNTINTLRKSEVLDSPKGISDPDERISMIDEQRNVTNSFAGLASDFDEYHSRPVKKSGRLKYECSSCKILVWGKPGLHLGCLDCDLQLEVVK